MKSNSQHSPTAWPSHAHRMALWRKQETKKEGHEINLLSPEERFQWVAYDYAFRRARGLIGSPYDPDGEWFDADLVKQAENAYPKPQRPEEAVSPAMQAMLRADHELARIFDDQDRERRKLADHMAANNIPWRRPDGSPTPEAEAYAALCVRQVEANAARFAARQKTRR